MPLAVPAFGLVAQSNALMTFAMLDMQQPFKLGYLWATLCLVGAVYFGLRS
jgi:uncharacterized protein (DUF486 family)